MINPVQMLFLSQIVLSSGQHSVIINGPLPANTPAYMPAKPVPYWREQKLYNFYTEPVIEKKQDRLPQTEAGSPLKLSTIVMASLIASFGTLWYVKTR